MTEPVDIDSVYDLRGLTAVAVSPDGDRVAFVVQECDAVADERRTALHVVPADGTADPYRLTRASTASNPRWSPDGSSLAFLA
jgi:dipeptidyl aminopeptidase/acylaminoacyl peptidase